MSDVEHITTALTTIQTEYGPDDLRRAVLENAMEALERLTAENSELTRLVSGFVEGCETAIERGDWTVDGACDPEMLLHRAKDILSTRP